MKGTVSAGDDVHEEGDARGEHTRIGSRAAARGRTLTHRGLDQTRHRSGAEFAGGELTLRTFAPGQDRDRGIRKRAKGAQQRTG